jgi:hypothetical protein
MANINSDLDPIIFTDGGAGDYHAPFAPNEETHTIPLPPGVTKPQAAWYTPMDNIGNPVLRKVVFGNFTNSTFDMTLGANAGGQVRIRIYLFY